MYALKVSINNETPIVGGAEDLGVLSAHVGCGGQLGSQTHRIRENETAHFDMSLRGLTRRAAGLPNEHLIWLQRWDLQLGDQVQIEIVQVDQADPTISESEAKQAESDEREYFDHVKKAYLQLREKFEPME